MGLGELALDLLERLAEVLQRLLRDADAGVLDGDVDVAADDARAHRDAAAVRRELHRVGQQIDDDLLDDAAVGAQPDRGLDLGLDGRAASRRRAPPPGAWCRRGRSRARTALGSKARAAGLDLRHVEDVVDDVEQIAPALADVAAVFEVFRVAERAEQPGLHDLGESDDGVERRAQLVAHVGEECRLRLVGLLGAVLLLGVALGQIGELLGLALERLLRGAQVDDRRLQPLLALDQLLLVPLELGDVGADRDEAAVLGAPLADLQPAAVVELRLEGARAGDRAALARELHAHDRLAAGRGNVLVGRAAQATASSVRPCRLWNLELHSTSRLSASHTTKASEIASIASLSRISAVALSSASRFCSVMSTAMPIRCGCGSPACRTSSQRARSQTQLPRAWRMRNTRSIEDELGVGELRGELVELHVVGMHEPADLAEAEQLVVRRQARGCRTSTATRTRGRWRGPSPTARSGRD